MEKSIVEVDSRWCGVKQKTEARGKEEYARDRSFAKLAKPRYSPIVFEVRRVKCLTCTYIRKKIHFSGDAKQKVTRCRIKLEKFRADARSSLVPSIPMKEGEKTKGEGDLFSLEFAEKCARRCGIREMGPIDSHGGIS